MTDRVLARRVVVCLAVVAGIVAAGRPGDAHNLLLSKYSYQDDVFPILRDKCGACHVDGGAAPMSLMTYNDALPWSEAIRTELMAGRMPPWGAKAGVGTFRSASALSAHELDVVLSWASGGNPPGDADKKTSKVALDNRWRLGPPDLTLALPMAVTLGPGVADVTREFTVATGTSEDRELRAVDILPQTPAMVLGASVSVRTREADTEARVGMPLERLVALWVPGQGPEVLDPGTAFRLPAAAELVVRVRYKKTWMYEKQSLADRSAIGLYFSARPSASVRTATLQASGTDQDYVVDDDVRVLAMRLDSRPPAADDNVKVDAALPDGSRLALIQFTGRSSLPRRYWPVHPIVLPRGTRVEVSGSLPAAVVLDLVRLGAPASN